MHFIFIKSLEKFYFTGHLENRQHLATLHFYSQSVKKVREIETHFHQENRKEKVGNALQEIPFNPIRNWSHNKRETPQNDLDYISWVPKSSSRCVFT